MVCLDHVQSFVSKRTLELEGHVFNTFVKNSYLLKRHYILFPSFNSNRQIVIQIQHRVTKNILVVE